MPEKKSPPKRKTKTVAKKVVVKKSRSAKKPAPKKKTVKKAKKREVVNPSPSLQLYRRIAVGFVVAVVAVLLAVLYISTMKATIVVQSVYEVVSTEFVVDVTGSPVQTHEIRGRVISGAIGRTQTVEPSGDEATAVDGIATGTVTLYNNSSASQPLVKTTRLLSPEGILFRLSDGVTVPAGGSVEAEVYADVEGVTGDIEPTTFTIPGLSEAKQALTYAESTEAFSGGVQLIAIITQEEMEAAAVVFQQELEEEVQRLLRAEAGEVYGGELFSAEVLETTYSIEPNIEADQYDITLSLQMIGVFFDQEALEELATRQIYEELGKGREFIEIGLSGMQISLEKYDLETEDANLHIELNGKVITSRTSEALMVDRFVGMNEAEVKALLLEEEVATDVTVEFFPFWVRKVPRLKDHIVIEIE